jgi:hypothetical protein
MKPKWNIVQIVIAASTMLFIFIGCTDLLSNPSSSSSSNIGVTIAGPVSNDSISYGSTKIDYDIKQDVGINFIELYLNDTIYKWNPPNTDGTKPVITLDFDSTKIGSVFSYFLIYYDKDGTSIKSDVMSNITITPVMDPPLAPYSVSLIRLSPSAVNISWKDSTFGSKPSYEIWRKAGSDTGFAKIADSSPGSFNINDETLIPNTFYSYKVRGINKYGSSLFSEAVSTTSGGSSSGQVAAPSNLQCVAVASNIVHLTWTDNSSNENYFRIDRRFSWTSFSSVGYVNKNVTAYSDSSNGLIAGREYIYRITAFSSSDSAWSSEVSVTTPVN